MDWLIGAGTLAVIVFVWWVMGKFVTETWDDDDRVYGGYSPRWKEEGHK